MMKKNHIFLKVLLAIALSSFQVSSYAAVEPVAAAEEMDPAVVALVALIKADPSSVASLVSNAIADNPGLAAKIVSAAIAEVPGAATAIVSAAIAQAPGSAAAIVSVAIAQAPDSAAEIISAASTATNVANIAPAAGDDGAGDDGNNEGGAEAGNNGSGNNAISELQIVSNQLDVSPQ